MTGDHDGPWVLRDQAHRRAADLYEDGEPDRAMNTGCYRWEKGTMPVPASVGGMSLFEDLSSRERHELRISLPGDRWEAFVEKAGELNVTPKRLMYDLLDKCTGFEDSRGYYSGIEISFDKKPLEPLDDRAGR